MAIATYAYVYQPGLFIGSLPGPITISGLNTTLTTITELASDGDGINGSTAIGQDAQVDGAFFAGATDTIVGVTPAGDPIIVNIFTEIFIVSNNPSLSGTQVTSTAGPYLYCFAPGTRIATPRGEEFVEDLSVGDPVTNLAGQVVPVKWIGRQTASKLFAGPHMQPVHIRAGALGNGLPHSDLTVTADHGMVLDGLVINASVLVNGTTIDFVPLDELPDQITYYHIETEAHDVILANGAAAETFVDAVTRSHFDNHAEYLDLYGAERLIPEMDRPRIASARLLPTRLRKRLGIGAVAPDAAA